MPKRYIYAAYNEKNLADLFLKVRQWDFQSFLSYTYIGKGVGREKCRQNFKKI